MLFGYFGDPSPHTSDVLGLEADAQSLSFDRPLHSGSELYLAGAMAFALSYGFNGLSLAEWATLEQVQEPGDVARPGARNPGIVCLDPELFDWVMALVETQRAAHSD
jgi:hypothetical protein